MRLGGGVVVEKDGAREGSRRRRRNRAGVPVLCFWKLMNMSLEGQLFYDPVCPSVSLVGLSIIRAGSYTSMLLSEHSIGTISLCFFIIMMEDEINNFVKTDHNHD